MKDKFKMRGLSLFTDGAQRSRRIGTVPGQARFNDSGRTTFETMLITSLVGILLFVAISNFLTSVRLVREVALRSELGNIRTAIMIHISVKRRYPESLREMLREGYVLPTGGGIIKYQFLEGMAVDKDGNLLDTFGNPFIYDKKTGWVKSGSKGYESW